MAKKFPAEKLTVFAVYHKVRILGELGRYFMVALPDWADAEEWIKNACADNERLDRSDFMIEEFTGTMKAWQP